MGQLVVLQLLHVCRRSICESTGRQECFSVKSVNEFPNSAVQRYSLNRETDRQKTDRQTPLKLLPTHIC